MKKILSIMCVLCLLCGCGAEKKENNKEEETVDSIQDNGSDKNPKNVFDNPVSLKIGERITVGDYLEFQFDTAEWMEEILPSNTSSSYSYVQDIENETFFVLKGVVKNISGNDIDVTYRLGMFRFVFNNKYQYTGNMEVENPNHDGFDSALKPLAETNLLLYVSVPTEVKDIYEKLQVDLLLGDGINDVYGEEDILYYYMMKFSNE